MSGERQILSKAWNPRKTIHKHTHTHARPQKLSFSLEQRNSACGVYWKNGAGGGREQQDTHFSSNGSITAQTRQQKSYILHCQQQSGAGDATTHTSTTRDFASVDYGTTLFVMKPLKFSKFTQFLSVPQSNYG